MNYVVNTPTQLKPILVGYRKSHGMSQKDMAEKLNVTQQAYQALESKPQSVTLERLMKVLNMLDVKLYLSDTELNTSSIKIITRKSNAQSDFVSVDVKTRNAPSNQITKKLNKDSW